MIYLNSYFSKELRQAFIENKISSKKKFAFAMFLGILAFATHFMLQALVASVLSDAVPHIMQRSYFSTVYTYNSIAYVLYVIYFIIYYNYLSFDEVRKNKWYLLVKMGYRPARMIFSKLLASLFSVFLIYSVGFLFTLILTVFLKYTFVYAYFPALYLSGLVDMLVITLISNAVSLYIRQLSTARYAILISAAFLLLLRRLLGFYDIVSNRVLMQSLHVLFDFSRSVYMPVMGGIIMLSFVVCFLRAKSIAAYYCVPYEMYGYIMPKNTDVVRVDGRTGKIRPLLDRDKGKVRARILNAAIITFLIIFVCAALIFNVFVIILSTSQPGEEVTIWGVIPYIFKSNTMEPTIMENDLAYFRRADAQEPINVGDIVLFLDNSEYFIERVISVENGEYRVDIDYYPPMSEKGVMIKTVKRAAIYGIYTHANRWLGALILFSNTIFGRILFMLGPAFLLFFYKPAIKNISQIFSKGSEDE